MTPPEAEADVDYALAVVDGSYDHDEQPRVLGRAVRELRAELAQWRSGERCVREPGCECTWEHGDSLCAVHPTDPDTGELLKIAAVMSERDEVRAAIDAAQRDVVAAGARIAELVVERDTARAERDSAREDRALLAQRVHVLEGRITAVRDAIKGAQG